MPVSNLWNNYRYRAPIEIIVDSVIRVYDIRKANISVLREVGILDQETYKYLYQAEKIDREIYIGKLLGANPGYSEILSKGIIEAKRRFFELNQIQDAEVLEVDNDAVYILGTKPIKQQVSKYVFFNLGEVYTSFYAVNHLRYFYYANRISNQEYLKVKGLGSAAPLHEPYMLDFLKALFQTAQFEGSDKAIELLMAFYNQYISRTLDMGFYRMLDSQSSYRFCKIDMIAPMYTNITNPRYKNIIDISFNEQVLRKFNQLLSSRYFKGK